MARLNWGDDGKLWGTEGLYWGEVDDDATTPADIPPVWFHSLVEITPMEGAVIRLWTGEGDLEFDEDGASNTWTGAGRIMNVGAIPSASTSSSDTGVTIAFAVPDEAQRTNWIVAVGARPVRVRLIASEDYGISWTILPTQKRGLMDSPTFSNGVYTFNVVHPFEVRDKSLIVNWSNEDQQARFPGDRGLEFMRLLAGGVDLKWPNL